MLQQIKHLLRDQLGVPPSLAFVVAGCVAHLIFNALLRKSPVAAWGLLAPFSLAVALEAYEIWVQYREVGLLAPGNDPLIAILGRHALDILVVMAGPLALVAIGALRTR